ncbi:hypothetical protein J2Z21_009583 [Streptomyces griseochromogenes]|uniref:Uncharacterized protein n=1 Tax=Streptomyces griseochromogenes TaxID=68214 RepID=A0ABS4MA65_9ACTN|nr:hypothetical protein [Streptomyces griseochromogenes]
MAKKKPQAGEPEGTRLAMDLPTATKESAW